MVIICDNQEEYDELMKASEYLHYETNVNTSYNEVVNFLAHLYCDYDDFPLKDEFVKIRNRNGICKI